MTRQSIIFLSLLFFVATGCQSEPPGPDYTYPGSEKSGAAFNGNGFSAQTYACKDSLEKVKKHYEKMESLSSFGWQVPSRLKAAGFSYDKEPFDIMEKKFFRHSFQGENVIVSVSAKKGAKSCWVLIVRGEVPK